MASSPLSETAVAKRLSSSSSSSSSSSLPWRSFVYKTPRGKCIVAHVPSYTTYDEFIATLLNKAAAVDQRSITDNNARGSYASPFQSRPCRINDNISRERVLKRRFNSEAPSCTPHSAPQPTIPYSELAYIVHNGKILDRSNYHTTLLANTNHSPSLTISLQLRIRGGMDRQNRVGSKFGGGGVSSSQQSERERKDRLRELALETVDLAKDPYLMRNHLGTYECKLCLTLHTNEVRLGLLLVVYMLQYHSGFDIPFFILSTGQLFSSYTREKASSRSRQTSHDGEKSQRTPIDHLSRCTRWIGRVHRSSKTHQNWSTWIYYCQIPPLGNQPTMS